MPKRAKYITVRKNYNTYAAAVLGLLDIIQFNPTGYSRPKCTMIYQKEFGGAEIVQTFKRDKHVKQGK